MDSSMYVHACMTHPAVFVFGSVIKGVVPGRALPSKCSVRKLTGDNKHISRKCSQ